MAKKRKEGNALAELLEAAPHKVLSKLITELTVMFPDVRRECFDFLKSQSTVSKTLAKRSEGEAVLALWSELAPDLEDLDMYGGGDYGTTGLIFGGSHLKQPLDAAELDDLPGASKTTPAPRARLPILKPLPKIFITYLPRM